MRVCVHAIFLWHGVARRYSSGELRKQAEHQKNRPRKEIRDTKCMYEGLELNLIYETSAVR